MTTPRVTKTLGPIHFEDLDPRRFEDLVRELIYDFKHWQSIEATGRGGSDDGFDIRAYETAAKASIENEDGELSEDQHPMEGNLWMLQCKRERELGPKKIAEIILDAINPQQPPYGYILAASANFSKAAYDTFRAELRSRGVMEFYLWGKAELEDMLHLPKNDHILFTFFGISLVSRRRSRTAEIRSVVNTKNKLLGILGEALHHQPVLFRDSKDTKYPYKSAYKDFQEHPRWKEYPVVQYHPLGLIVNVAEHFAFFDADKKEWDTTEALNLVRREIDDNEARDEFQDLREKINDFWEYFPRAKQATHVRNGLVRFDSILVIDDKGDSEFKFPHLYVDFHADRGPFIGFHEYLRLSEYHQESLEELKRTKVFPSSFPKPKIGTIHRDKIVTFDDQNLHFLKHGSGVQTLYDCDAKYDFLEPSDVISVAKSEGVDGKRVLIKITNKKKLEVDAYLAQQDSDPTLKSRIEQQIGRSLTSENSLVIYEFKRIYDWQLEKS